MHFRVILMNFIVCGVVEGIHLHYNLSHEEISRQTDASNKTMRTLVTGEPNEAQRTLNGSGVTQPRISSAGTQNESHTYTSPSPTSTEVVSTGKGHKVLTPNQKCSNDSDCPNSDADGGVPALCTAGRCDCPTGLCWHYQYLFGSADIDYFCSTCGTLGSMCGNNGCDPPGECRTDGFCHCDEGENNHGVCFIITTAYENNILTLALGAIATILYFILCAIAFRPEGGYFALRGCRRLPWFASDAMAMERDFAAIRRARRGRTLKTQAFTHTERMRELQSSEDDVWTSEQPAAE